jgi:hypothetical protein
MCVHAGQADGVVKELKAAGCSVAAVIGEITAGPAGTIEID